MMSLVIEQVQQRLPYGPLELLPARSPVRDLALQERIGQPFDEDDE